MKEFTWHRADIDKPDEWENTQVSLTVLACNSLKRMFAASYHFNMGKWYNGATEVTVKAWRYMPELPSNELIYW